MIAAPDESLWVGILRVVLHFPDARSRKDKRKVISKLRDRFRSRYNLSVAEIGHLETYRQGVFAAAMIGNDAKSIRSFLDSRENEIYSLVDARVEDTSITLNKFDPNPPRIRHD